jgi:hypothetical protein
MRKLMMLVAVFGLVGSLWAADPHVGTWKLNVAKSRISSGAADRSAVVVCTVQDSGTKLLSDGVDADGKPFHAEFTAKYDGKDYPFKGESDIDTVALRRIDANTWSEVLKKDGKEVVSGQNAISKDGKTMTRTVKGKTATGQDINNTIVYDKQ